jgi:hypothetical protein
MHRLASLFVALCTLPAAYTAGWVISSLLSDGVRVRKDSPEIILMMIPVALCALVGIACSIALWRQEAETQQGTRTLLVLGVLIPTAFAGITGYAALTIGRSLWVDTF